MTSREKAKQMAQKFAEITNRKASYYESNPINTVDGWWVPLTDGMAIFSSDGATGIELDDPDDRLNPFVSIESVREYCAAMDQVEAVDEVFPSVELAAELAEILGKTMITDKAQYYTNHTIEIDSGLSIELEDDSEGCSGCNLVARNPGGGLAYEHGGSITLQEMTLIINSFRQAVKNVSTRHKTTTEEAA